MVRVEFGQPAAPSPLFPIGSEERQRKRIKEGSASLLLPSGGGSLIQGSLPFGSPCVPTLCLASPPLTVSRRRYSVSLTGNRMPRSSRKTGSAAVNSSTASDIFRSASSKAVSKELERIDHLFHSYADSSSGMIGPEGIESLCLDIGVDHTDIRILMLAWKMIAEKQGYFTLEEWRRGLKALRADSISKIKKALPELEKDVRCPQNFLEFYSYAFRYCLTEDKQKSIDIETICELLDLILGSLYRSQVDKLMEYLKMQQDYKVINMDQWTGFLRFCEEINFPSLNNYDSELAWPLILDNFVEWMQGKQS